MVKKILWLILVLGPGFTALAQDSSPYAAVAKGKVDVEGGVVYLAGRRDGIVREVFVEEGDSVKKGQILAVLDDALARSNFELARSEFKKVQTDMALLQIKRAAADREVKRLAKLLPIQAVATQEFDQAQDRLRLSEAELTQAQAVRETISARVALAQQEIELYKVRAPCDGKIVKRFAKPGFGVSVLNSTALFIIVPDTSRIVRAELDERFVSAVKAGMEAEVMPETDETVRVAAQVLRVGDLFGVKQAADDPSERVDVRVVELVLTGSFEEFRIGQRVLVRVKKNKP